MKEKKVRQLAAVMFTDIVGYTAIMQGDEEVATKVRKRHREVFQQQHNLHQGEIIQYYGDGTLNVLNNTEVYGDGVSYASRIESLGTAGAILLSDKINDELKNHSAISTTSLGHFELKHIAKPVEIFGISNKGIKVPNPMELKGKQKSVNKTIAVLPFVNLSASKDNEYFSDVITEEIINALAKIKSLKVTSRTSSFFFKNKNISIKQIEKKLGVFTILEGSIRLSGNTIRILAQLIQAEEDFHLGGKNNSVYKPGFGAKRSIIWRKPD